jgi:hypothetical protein
LVLANPKVVSLANNEAALLISILDPESFLLPEEIRYNWESSKEMHALSRDYFSNVHKKWINFMRRKADLFAQ